ncbi:hypothetical protein [Rhodopirellula sallentina]|uniref:Uncharacterized protein n=1 Tax=Rhodopirellula sallentina SM41 TaxID=1263870 RepID=M5TYL7_9BACT|nr:hypothetical protein [Rhodopirellula sallentina]EMI54129.1 hypothetical protein RSSM_04443 [Rhodopirellula sallentina SM41]
MFEEWPNCIGVLFQAGHKNYPTLIAKHKGGDVNIRASYILTANDVILSGLIVKRSGSQIPELVVGTLVATLVVRGGLGIMIDVRMETSAP